MRVGKINPAKVLTRDLPESVILIIRENDCLGFNFVAQAIDFILANEDWYSLVHDLKLNVFDLSAVNSWRSATINLNKLTALVEKGTT